MKWKETIASRCRYSEEAETIWGHMEIIWEDSEDDYQGHAHILAVERADSGSGELRLWEYKWQYGPCSECDDWEDRECTPTEIMKDMLEEAVVYRGKKEIKNTGNWEVSPQSVVRLSHPTLALTRRRRSCGKTGKG
jgi:hypothetical protein